MAFTTAESIWKEDSRPFIDYECPLPYSPIRWRAFVIDPSRLYSAYSMKYMSLQKCDYSARFALGAEPILARFLKSAF